MNNIFDIIVVGGGPSGMMAAATAAEKGKKVLLLERNEKLGKKLFITGKGRCNVTNSSPIGEYYQHIASNEKFLRGPFHKFDNEDLIGFLESFGLKTKVERGNRVFPSSDKSSDVINTLIKALKARNVSYYLNCRIRKIEIDQQVFKVYSEQDVYYSKKIIIATGGLSYPSTGSTGDGYTFAKALGHTVTETRPSLVPLFSKDKVCSELKGISLRNVSLKIVQKNKKTGSEIGEMLFTGNGISGPLVLTASCYINDPEKETTDCLIDLKPALDEKTLDQRILRDFDMFKNKTIRNGLSKLLINALILPVLSQSEVDPEKKINEITKDERKRILNSIKNFSIHIDSFGDYNEAVITRGGISVKEINPQNMESRIVPGLYFAGEVIDIDAETGGYNLQIAFTTGFLAGFSSAEKFSKIDNFAHKI